MPVETRYLLFDEKDRINILEDIYIKCSERTEGSIILELEGSPSLFSFIDEIFNKINNSNTVRLIIDDKINLAFETQTSEIIKMIKSNPKSSVSKEIKVISRKFDMEGDL